MNAFSPSLGLMSICDSYGKFRKLGQLGQIDLILQLQYQQNL